MPQTPPSVKAVCIYSDENGASHLKDVYLPAMTHTIDENGKTYFSGRAGATSIGFVVGSGDGNKDWHVSNIAGLSIVLSGAWEIEAGSGERRVLDTGSILLMLDTHGQGHKAHNYGDNWATVIGIHVDEDTHKAYCELAGISAV